MLTALHLIAVAALATGPQEEPPAPRPPAPEKAAASPAARPEDVATPDAILASLYDVISGPAGKARDWDRFRSLFLPGARLIPLGGGRDQRFNPRVFTPDDYVRIAGAHLEQAGFFEREIHRKAETFGRLIHVWSTYESRTKQDDEKPFARGINSIQLAWDGTRHYFVSVAWDAEAPGRPIPPDYLPK